MDTTAYLASHGWEGKGHALQPSGRGLKKPLLVSHKQNVLGLGKAKDSLITSQWWLHSFDKSLKGFDLQDKITSNQSLATQAEARNRGDATQRVLNKYFDKADLYGRFVTGDGLKGTIGITNHENATPIDRIIRGVDAADMDMSQIRESETQKCRRKKSRGEATTGTGYFKHDLVIPTASDQRSKKKQRREESATSRSEAEAAIVIPERVKVSRKKKRCPRQLVVDGLAKATSDRNHAATEHPANTSYSEEVEIQRHKDRALGSKTLRSSQFMDVVPGECNEDEAKPNLRKKRRQRKQNDGNGKL